MCLKVNCFEKTRSFACNIVSSIASSCFFWFNDHYPWKTAPPDNSLHGILPQEVTPKLLFPSQLSPNSPPWTISPIKFAPGQFPPRLLPPGQLPPNNSPTNFLSG